jgi:hypothetical protein
VRPGGFVLATVIQLGIFVAPLALARGGVMDGEVAGLAAIVSWFVLGVPLSYAAGDTVRRRQARAVSNPKKRLRSVSTPT